MSDMRKSFCLAFLLLGAWTTLNYSRLTQASSSHKRIPIKIIGEGNNFPGQIWGQMYFPPMLSFRVLSGKLPERRITILCEVVEEHQAADGKRYTILSLHCEEGLVMELEGIDLQGGRQ